MGGRVLPSPQDCWDWLQTSSEVGEGEDKVELMSCTNHCVVSKLMVAGTKSSRYYVVGNMTENIPQ